MPHYLSDDELRQTAPAELASFQSPVPTQIVSNGEFNPLPQTREQARVEARIKELSEDLSSRHGMNRRQFLASSAGMAASRSGTVHMAGRRPPSSVQPKRRWCSRWRESSWSL